MNNIKNIVYTISLLFTLLIPAVAVNNVDFYGNIRLGSWWSREQDFTKDTLRFNTSNNNTEIGHDTVPLYLMDFKPYGEFGFNIKTEKLKFVFGYGTITSLTGTRYYFSQTSGLFFGTRSTFFNQVNHCFGEWNITDNFSLLLGKTLSPCNFSTSNQGLYGGWGLKNCGVLTSGSRPQIQFSIKKNIGTAFSFNGKIAALPVDTIAIPYWNFVAKDTLFEDPDPITGELDTVPGIYLTLNQMEVNELHPIKNSYSTPKFEASLGFNFEQDMFGFTLNVAGGYQEYKNIWKPFADSSNKQYDPATNDLVKKETIQSYIAGIEGTVKVGPILLGATYTQGKNIGSYGVTIGNPYRMRDRPDADNITIHYPSNGRADVLFPSGKTLPIISLDDPSKLIRKDTINLNEIDLSLHNSFTKEMAFVAKVKPLGYLSFEGGVGIIIPRHEDERKNSQAENTYTFYGQAEIEIGNSIILTPEGGYINYGPHHHQGVFYYGGFNATFKF